tara:strand:+ start:1662 stop:3485 length:1824 start_codon:yes stop_codon:yes gene_type:complete
MATVKALHIAIGARVEGFQRGMSKAQRSLRNFEKSTRRARGMVVGATGAMARGFAAVGTAATIAIADSIRVFADFETSMLRVKAISGATGVEFQSLSDLAKELGSTTAFTAREAAQAMGFLAQAGFDVGEVHKALPKVLSLAAAGQLDLAQAADITASVLRGFGLEASESGRVADVLAAAASKSNTSVEGMGEAFKFAGPVASAMGVSLEETAAALGVLSNAGLKGSLAGTGLRMVLVKMGEDVAGAGGLTQALETLNTEGVQAVVDTMKDLDARAGTAAVALTGQMGTLKSLTEEMRNVEGMSDKMAETLLSGVTGSAVKAGSAFEGLRIKLGETFEQFGVGFFEELTLTFQTLNEVIGDMKGEFGDLNTIGKEVARTFLVIAESIGLMATGTIDVIDKLLAVRSAFNAVFQMTGMGRQKFGLENIDFGFDLGKEFKRAGALTTGFTRTEKLQEMILKLSAALDPLSKAITTTPAPGGGDQVQMDGLAGKGVMSKFLTKSEMEQIFDGRSPIAAVEQVSPSLQRLRDELEAILGAQRFLPFGLTTEPPKAAAGEQVSGFTEGIQTALGMVKVDPTAAKKDSDNLQEIAKNTGGMFKEMLTRLESFT